MSNKKILPKTKLPKAKQAKKKIPKALREQVWVQTIGNKFEHKCIVEWCNNNMTVFDFHVGHNIPESKGGTTALQNLKPICSRCNLSMGNQYSIEEWSKIGCNLPKRPWWLICC